MNDNTPPIPTPTAEGTASSSPTPLGTALVRHEWPLALNLATVGLFAVFGDGFMAHLANPLVLACVGVWLLAVILLSAFAIVRHAEGLAELLGEPLGTLILTLSVIGIEVMMISAVMLTGDGSPDMARDTMFAVVMLVMNGMVGASLVLGSWKHTEQEYNLQGANAFLALILPLAVLGLVLPNVTTSSPGPTFSIFQGVFLSLMSVAVYVVFLAAQSWRHRSYFLAPEAARALDKATRRSLGHAPGPARSLAADMAADEHHEARSVPYHAVLLLAFLVPMVFLAKQLAVPLDYAMGALRAPSALGGFVVALLILSPEIMTAIRAAFANELQRAVNISLGSVLATISLTIPAVLAIGFVTNQIVLLGLPPTDMVMLLLTLAVSMVTFSSRRTNVLHGAVHLLLFLAYVMLIFAG